MHNVEEVIREKAILVGIIHKSQSEDDVAEYLEELEFLADTAGLQVLKKEVQERKIIDPAYFIGKGKVKFLAEMVEKLDADVVVFDDDLSPAQARNIEKICDVKIIDRSGIILDIFAKRAKTREAKTQVELAQLQYLLPRLTRLWTHLSRQASGAGVGLRGPGEKQLEVDRRLIRKQIIRLQTELEKIKKQRHVRRKHREQLYKVALIGYTNVGKSTLLNVLTDSDVFVEDRLFATLDSTVRRLPCPNNSNILLIDTVGFIRKLPHQLIASFKSTLEETQDADLLLHVIDISSHAFRKQIQTVQHVMKDLNITDKPILHVFNKIDKYHDDFQLNFIRQEYNPCIFVSAQRNIFLNDLKQKIFEYANNNYTELEVKININDQKRISYIYNIAEVLERTFNNGFASLRVRIDNSKLSQFERLVENSIAT